MNVCLSRWNFAEIYKLSLYTFDIACENFTYSKSKNQSFFLEVRRKFYRFFM